MNMRSLLVCRYRSYHRGHVITFGKHAKIFGEERYPKVERCAAYTGTRCTYLSHVFVLGVVGFVRCDAYGPDGRALDSAQEKTQPSVSLKRRVLCMGKRGSGRERDADTIAAISSYGPLLRGKSLWIVGLVVRDNRSYGSGNADALGHDHRKTLGSTVVGGGMRYETAKKQCGKGET